MELIKMKWDMIIAHPPCTYLTHAGANILFNKDHTVKDEERFQKGKQAAEFFMKFLRADCPRIAVENPVPMKIFGLPRYDEIIEPYMFGDPWRKRTCLWLKGLPPLIMTEAPMEPKGLWVGVSKLRKEEREKKGYKYELPNHKDGKTRAKTFQGIARAMAEQWAGRIDGED